MKITTKIFLFIIFVFYQFNSFAQDYPKVDDKISVMNDIEKIIDDSNPSSIKKWWTKQRDVEDFSFCIGYVSCGVPWGIQALHGGSFGISRDHLLFETDFGLGSMIDENAYDNIDVFDVLNEKSTQGFVSSSIQYYPIKIFSVGFGLRVHQELEKSYISYTSLSGSGYSIETDETSFENNGFVDIRLVARVYLPISDKVSLYLSSGYDITPKNTRKNKLELGLGIKLTAFE